MQKTAGGRLTEWTAWCSRHTVYDMGDQSNILTRAMELLVVNIRYSMAMMSRWRLSALLAYMIDPTRWPMHHRTHSVPVLRRHRPSNIFTVDFSPPIFVGLFTEPPVISKSVFTNLTRPRFKRCVDGVRGSLTVDPSRAFR
jgi:hypothetical protein